MDDRKITIAVGASRMDTHWKNQEIAVSALFERLRTPVRGTESQADYLAYPKTQQDALKDVGGFVAGKLIGSRRKAANVAGRDIVTLDMDTIPPFETDKILTKLRLFGDAFCVYSTRKHTPERPRLRILYPLSRTVSVDEYEPIARKMAARIGINMADPTTFEPSRLMYWPSASADGEYVYETGGTGLLDPDKVLASYTDWKNIGEWPRAKGEQVNYKSLAAKQGDPETKPGVVGAFCRAYDIYSAMELIPGVYAEVEGAQMMRYTFCGGSTTGGAVIYQDGKFLYSHHATDPCSGKLVNAFDMIRLHKFGDLDEQAKDGTPFTRLPSYVAMCKFAVADPKCSALILKERREEAMKDFEDIANRMAEQSGDEAPAPPSVATDDLAWMAKLATSPSTGKVENTIDNALIILENDPLLKGRFALNEFTGRGEVLADLPWDARKVHRMWQDEDSDGLYWYMEKAYALKGRKEIDSALAVHANTHRFNEVQDFINGLKWDGVPRLDTLLIDCFDADDTPYTRAVTRKAFTAAVARAMTPGCKYDFMLILCGEQGIGKSTLLKKMSMGWFNDNIWTFDGRGASELLQGVWIAEVQELAAFSKSDTGDIKKFLSSAVDQYRAAYGKFKKEYPRRCVFFGTSNDVDFLRDMTGNRRFWPVDLNIEPGRMKPELEHMSDDTIRQLWAEAKVRWQLGEPLYLTGTVARDAMSRQESHRERDVKEGAIEDFIVRLVPEGWNKYSVDRRRDYWALHSEPSAEEQEAMSKGLAEAVEADGTKLVKRDRICANEILQERFNARELNIRQSDKQAVNRILAKQHDLLKRPDKPVIRCGPYGSQRGFVYK